MAIVICGNCSAKNRVPVLPAGKKAICGACAEPLGEFDDDDDDLDEDDDLDDDDFDDEEEDDVDDSE